MLEMRTSERGDLKRCVQKWYWGQVEGLVSKRPANPLWFGSAVHEALAAWYLPGLERGPHPVETFTKVLEGDRRMIVTNDEQELEYQDARQLGIDMMTRYVEKYGEDSDMFFIATEQKGSVLLARPEVKIFDTTQARQAKWLRYRFTFDGVFRKLSTDELWLAEHKTAASIRVDHLPLDDQAGSYWALAGGKLRKMGVVKEDETIAGIEYNFLRKAVSDNRPINAAGKYTNKPKKEHYLDAAIKFDGDLMKLTLIELEQLAEIQKIQVFGDASAVQPGPYFERFEVYRSRGERATQIKRIQEEAIFAEAYRQGWLPITKSPDKQWCNWCPFHTMCITHEQGDMFSVEEMKQSMYALRDPYEAYRTERKSAES